MLRFISCPVSCILLRSSPKIFMAMLDWVPDSMASIRCDMGCPISMFTPGMTESLLRISFITCSLLRSERVNGASISEVFTPRACSSSSARPVLRATLFISGTVSSISSANFPVLSLSSNDSPGNALMFIVKEPSLNVGRKLRPIVKRAAMEMIKSAAESVIMVPAWFSAHVRVVW